MISKTEESIHILNVLTESLNKFFSSLTDLVLYKVDDVTVSNLNQLTFEYGMILSASYLDEYKDHFSTSLNQEDRIRMSPFLKLINVEFRRFSDIKRYRNNISAHNLRADNRNVFLYGNLRGYKIPQNIREFKYLKDCITILTNIINVHFPDADKSVRRAVAIKQQEDPTPYIEAMTQETIDELLINVVTKIASLNQQVTER